jgi:hypothetical protein
MTSKEIFDLASQIVETAKNKEEAELDELIQIGFELKDLSIEEKNSWRAPNVLYTMYGNDGNKVEVKYYAYDPTKTFSPTEPDMNKIYVWLYDEDDKKIDEYHVWFSDKPYGS